MSWKLFLDDERFPKEPRFTIARDNETAIELVLEKGLPIHISFDFYLEGDNTTEYFAYWLCRHIEEGNPLPEGFTYSTHSASTEGRKVIRKMMDERVLVKDKEIKKQLNKAQEEKQTLV